MLREHTQRIDTHIFVSIPEAHLEMKRRACNIPGASYRSDSVAPVYFLPVGYIDIVKMTVNRDVPVVVYHHAFSVADGPLGSIDLPICGGKYRSSALRRDVYALMTVVSAVAVHHLRDKTAVSADHPAELHFPIRVHQLARLAVFANLKVQVYSCAAARHAGSGYRISGADLLPLADVHAAQAGVYRTYSAAVVYHDVLP